MATTKFYLDLRGIDSDMPAPLKLSISEKQNTSFISLNISLLSSQWDKRKERVIKHPDKDFLNVYIAKKKSEIDILLLKLADDGQLRGMSATAIKNRVLWELSPEKDSRRLFGYRFLSFANAKKESTREIYMHTYRRMCAYVPAGLDKLAFEDITKEWLVGFDTFLARTSPSKNARNIHFRNIRAVFNEAIDDEITVAYPFRRFKIRPVATRKRSLTVEQLRTLFDFPVEEHVQKYVDMFKLIFMLIGINVIDLCNLRRVVNGRVEYNRAKTERLYSIKVEPEAMKIIERYRGERFLLDILDRYANHKDYTHKLNYNLKLVGPVVVGKQGKKVYEPLFPEISSYWARHTWATIAAELDIPKETIAAALGHSIGNPTTSIYIDFNEKKIDEANRRVLDWVLYGVR